MCCWGKRPKGLQCRLLTPRVLLLGVLFWLAFGLLLFMKINDERGNRQMKGYWDWLKKQIASSAESKRGKIARGPRLCPKNSVLITSLRELKKRLKEERLHPSPQQIQMEEKILKEKAGTKLILTYFPGSWTGWGISITTYKKMIADVI